MVGIDIDGTDGGDIGGRGLTAAAQRGDFGAHHVNPRGLGCRGVDDVRHRIAQTHSDGQFGFTDAALASLHWRTKGVPRRINVLCDRALLGAYAEDRSQADVIVPDFQLSLAIGKEGQNARLAARLAGVRIDIKSETQHNNELNGIFEDAEYADGEWVLNAETGAQEFHAADGSVMSVEEWEKVTSGITAVAVEDEA